MAVLIHLNIKEAIEISEPSIAGWCESFCTHIFLHTMIVAGMIRLDAIMVEAIKEDDVLYFMRKRNLLRVSLSWWDDSSIVLVLKVLEALLIIPAACPSYLASLSSRWRWLLNSRPRYISTSPTSQDTGTWMKVLDFKSIEFTNGSLRGFTSCLLLPLFWRCANGAQVVARLAQMEPGNKLMILGYVLGEFFHGRLLSTNWLGCCWYHQWKLGCYPVHELCVISSH